MLATTKMKNAALLLGSLSAGVLAQERPSNHEVCAGTDCIAGSDVRRQPPAHCVRMRLCRALQMRGSVSQRRGAARR